MRCVVAGPAYGAGPVHAALLGRGYRELWTAPVEVPVLDLDAAGGLQPVEVLGHVQSRSLALSAADGRSFTFRSTDKDASQLVTGAMRYIPGVLRAYRDQTAAGLPAAPIVAAPLARAAGVLESDAPARRDAGRSAPRNLSRRVRGPPRHPRGVRDAGGGRPPRNLRRPRDRRDLGAVAAPGRRTRPSAWTRAPTCAPVSSTSCSATSTATPGQWRWARLEPGGPWHPIAEDRDLAFVRFEGLLPRVSRPWFPLLASFDGDFQVELPRLPGARQRCPAARSPRRRGVARGDGCRAGASRAAGPRRRRGPDARPLARAGGRSARRDLAPPRRLPRHRGRRPLRPPRRGSRNLGYASPEEVRARPLYDGRLDLSVTVAGAGAPRYRRLLKASETHGVRLCDFEDPDRVLLEAAAQHAIEVRAVAHCEPPAKIVAPGAKDSAG